MDWYIEKVRQPSGIIDGGTGAASSELNEGADRGATVILHLRAEEDGIDIATVRVGTGQQISQLIFQNQAIPFFSIEDLKGRLRDHGLEPMTQETYRQITTALVEAKMGSPYGIKISQSTPQRR